MGSEGRRLQNGGLREVCTPALMHAACELGASTQGPSHTYTVGAAPAATPELPLCAAPPFPARHGLSPPVIPLPLAPLGSTWLAQTSR
eukprot:scaffold17690_cov119-Isochrysis_galbana.AAC.1